MATLQNLDWLKNYTTQSPVQAGAQWSANYLKPIADVTTDIVGKYKAGINKDKIDEIIADETKKAEIRKGMTPVDAEGNATGGPAKGELDYKSLERRLLPYDQELSAKYGLLAEKQATADEATALKREQFNAAAKVKADAELEKKQSLSNKFDLSTDEGKLGWQKQYSALRTAMYQPGYIESSAELVKKPTEAAMKNLIEQANDYPELLATVGLSALKQPQTVIESPDLAVVKDMIAKGTMSKEDLAKIDLTKWVHKITPAERNDLIKGEVTTPIKNDYDSLISSIDAQIPESKKGVINPTSSKEIVRKWTTSKGLSVKDPDVANAYAHIDDIIQAAKTKYDADVAAGKIAKEDLQTAKGDIEKKLSTFKTDNTAKIAQVKAVSLLRNSFSDLNNRTNQLNVKKIRLRMASNEAVNNADIIQSNDFNALQQAASKLGLEISPLTEAGAQEDVNFIKNTYSTILSDLDNVASDDKDIAKFVNDLKKANPLPGVSSSKVVPTGKKSVPFVKGTKYPEGSYVTIGTSNYVIRNGKPVSK